MSRRKPKPGLTSRKEESFEGVGSRRRSFTDEFDAEAVQLLVDGHAAGSVCDRLGLLDVNLLYSWKQILLSVGRGPPQWDWRLGSGKLKRSCDESSGSATSCPVGRSLLLDIALCARPGRMSVTETCYDNAFMESCLGRMSILRCEEEPELVEYANGSEAARGLAAYT